MRSILSDFWASRELTLHLIRRNLQSRFRESFLGSFWALIPGVAMAIGFSLAAKANLVNIGPTDVPYPLFVILGTCLWQLFVESMNGPVAAFTSSKGMIARVRFPRESVFLAKIGEVLIDFAAKVLILAAVFFAYGISPGPLLWFAPIGILSVMAFGTAIGLILVPMSVLFQDAVKTVTLSTGYWFFITPVAYPAPKEGMIATLVAYNPVTPLIVTLRESIVSSEFTMMSPFLAITMISLITVCVAWIIVYVSIPHLVERMSS